MKFKVPYNSMQKLKINGTKSLSSLLVLSNDFPDEQNQYPGNIFVKEQVSALSSYFKHIFVVIPLPIGIEYKRKTHYQNYSFDNVSVHFIKYLNPLFPLTWYYFRDIWTQYEIKAIKNFLQRENINFNLIHAHYSWPSGTTAVKLKRIFQKPVIITEHAHVTLYPLIAKRDKILVKTWKQADAIIRVNRRDINLFATIVPHNKLFHVPNGYNSDDIKIVPKDIARAKLGLPADVKIIFNLAMLLPYKGHKYLISAMREILQERKDVLCFIGGHGPLKKSLTQQINHLDLRDNVKLVGLIPHNEVSYWYCAADLFVLPSITESFGIVQIEAMACGKPVVATYNRASDEIIISEDYGYICEPENPKEMADNILAALDKKWDEEKIKEYSKEFTWDKNARDTIEVYRNTQLDFENHAIN